MFIVQHKQRSVVSVQRVVKQAEKGEIHEILFWFTWVTVLVSGAGDDTEDDYTL